MLKNLITVTFRNLQRQKFFAFLNITGLAIGIASFLLMSLYIYDELHYDHFHEKLDRIVRVNQTFIWGETDNLFGSTGPALRDVLQSEVPEFETVVRIHQPNSFLVTYLAEDGSSRMFDEAGILAADSNLLAVFTFPLEKGNPNTCLAHPNSVIITPTTARKYFGDEEAMGKTLLFGEGEDQKIVKITGVLKEIPANSHIDFDFMLSMSTFPRVQRDRHSWIWTTFVTFGLLHENATLESAKAHIPNILKTRLSRFLQAYRGMTYEEYVASGKEWSIYFQPLADIHLRSENVWSRLNEVGSMDNVYIFGTIAILILTISLINFINLATARAATRAKEVGIRKVIGSGKRNLIFQFLVESMAYTFLAALLAIILAEAAVPLFNSLSGKDLSFNISDSPTMLLSILAGSCLLGILGGLYPAFYLTAFQPAAVLKGKIKAGMRSSGIRNTLVIFQFGISIVLISSSMIVFDQMTFTKAYDLGFDRTNKVIIKNVNRLGETQMLAFEEELRKLALIERVSLSTDAPPFIYDGDNFFLDGQEKNKVPLNFNLVDEEFVEVYQLPLIAGRNFRSDGTEINKIIINETAMRSFGYRNPEEILGVTINYSNVPLSVVGVLSDFSFSFEEIMPAAIIPQGSEVHSNKYRSISLQLSRSVSQEEIAALLMKIEDTWYAFNNKVPFDYTFLDQEYASLFAPVMKFGKLLGVFSALAVFVACLGLVGLIAFVIEKRNKEIGIRKIMGASISDIMLLLSGQFGKLLLIGLAISVPITWYFMTSWLAGFEYHTTIDLLTFIYAGIIMVAIAFIATSFQTIKAALVNPVESIKDE